MTDFVFRTVRTTVADAHGTVFPAALAHEVWFIEPTDAAVVLGSAQPLSTLDLGAVARRGLSVVRRHSGGGAVVVEPGCATWFDVWLPAADDRFERDVSRSTRWLGEIVVEALDAVGVQGAVAEVAGVEPIGSGRARHWSSLVCFAGVASGEIMVDGRKAVGISQRRTRAGARFQVMIPHRFDPASTAALFALSSGDSDELAGILTSGVTAVDIDPATMRTALATAFIGP